MEIEVPDIIIKISEKERRILADALNYYSNALKGDNMAVTVIELRDKLRDIRGN